MDDPTPHSPPPTRYRDPLANESPRLALFRRMHRLPPPTDEELSRFRDHLFEGDPLADDVVRLFGTLGPGEGYRLVERAIRDGIASVPGAPAPLVALFTQLEARPGWVDDAKLDLAAHTSYRVGMSGERVLNCICLMGGYRSSAANKPIAFTGALESMAYRRLAETSKFVLDLYESRRLPRGSAGYRAAVMVRLMHASVRARLTRDPRWRPGDWGLPVNQSDMLATNLLFSAVYVIGLRLLGHVVTGREADSLVHFWRYVGHLMGIRPDLLPRDFREACSQVYLSGATQPPGDDDSRRLAAALLSVPVRPGQGPTLARLDVQWRAGFSRLALGGRECDELGLPDTAAKWLVLASGAWNLATELFRLSVPGGEAFIVRRRRAEVQRTLEHVLGGVPPEYKPYPVRGETGVRAPA